MDLETKVAIFRFGVISGILHDNRLAKRAYFRQMAQKEYDVPGKGHVRYKWETFKKWLQLYQKYGFDGLKPSSRTDKGISRKISGELKRKIIKIAEETDLKTTSNLYRHLLNNRVITAESFTEATLRNFIRNTDLRLRGIEKKERRAFEMPHINMLWTADFMHGPYIRVGKRKVKVYLCVIIDDYSRVLVGAMFFLAESSLSLQITLKQATLTYGQPLKLYCDNGKVFVSGYLHLVCARLGISLVHSKPYDSPSRGKIERVIRTIRLMFLPNINITDEYTLEDLNQDLKSWISNVYHQRIHSGTGEKPIDRYINDMPNVKLRKISTDEADRLFYHAIYRTVKNDCTVSINKKLYEVPAAYIDMKVEIRYPLNDPEDLRLFENDSQVAKLTLLDKHYNAQNIIRYDDEQEDADV